MIKLLYYTKWPIAILLIPVAIVLVLIAIPCASVTYSLLWVIGKLKQFTTLLNFIQIPKL
jgi:hypothetical protein